MKTRDQAIDDLALSPAYESSVPRFGSDYCKALVAIFGDDWCNGHVLVKARRDLLKAVERAKDYPARAALVEAKQKRRTEYYPSPEHLPGGKYHAGNLVFMQDQPVRTLDGGEEGEA